MNSSRFYPIEAKQDLSTSKQELIVVGAGPAGAMAAYHAACRGVNVTILDRVARPRAKPCAGGLSTKALAQLPFSVAEVVEKSTKHISIGLDYNAKTTLSADGIICGFVVRKEFDRHLLEQAQKAGAGFRRIEKMDSISVGEKQVRLGIGEGKSLSAKYLIAADGANSQIRRMVRPHGAFSRGFAVEGNVPRARLTTAPSMQINFGCLQFGYGWVFPKGDHVNVGLYTCRETVRLNKNMLRDYALTILGTDDVKDIVGFPLGFGGKTYVQTEERILFAGDAAGMAEPLLGEGIYNAIRSGEMAGRAVANALARGRPALKAYNSSLRSIRRDLQRGEMVSRLFYKHLNKIGFKVLRNPMISSGLIKGYAAGKSFHQITDKFALMPWQKPLRSDRIQELGS